MQASRIAAIILSLIFLPGAAPAVDISGQSRTYFLYRQTPDNLRYEPLYEYINLRAGDDGDVSFQAGGWYRYDLGEPTLGTRRTGDLQYAYLSIGRPTGNAVVDIGRIVVTEGIAALPVDGVRARTDLGANFGVSLFGGSPIETLRDTRTGDSVYGGRISHTIPGVSVLGLSALQEKNNSSDYRKEAGVDLWLRPAPRMEITGLSSYNDLVRGWMQHSYNLVLGPFGPLRLTGEASRVYYDRYFRSTNLSAFAFPNIDPRETVTTTGGSADLAVLDGLSVVADYRKFSYDILNNDAAYYGGRLLFRSADFGAGGGYHRMDGPVDRLRYDEYRAFITAKASRADLTLDGMRIVYDAPINGMSASTTGTAALGFNLTPHARIVADGSYSRNPDYQRDVRGMLTLTYRFDASFDGRTRSAPTSVPAPAGKRK